MLAERLGVSNVDKLAASMTAQQRREWMTYAAAAGWFRGIYETEKQQQTAQEMIANRYG